MGKKKKNGNEKRLASILLITAIIQLMQAIVELINNRLHEIQGREISLVRRRYTFSLPMSI